MQLHEEFGRFGNNVFNREKCNASLMSTPDRRAASPAQWPPREDGLEFDSEEMMEDFSKESERIFTSDDEINVKVIEIGGSGWYSPGRVD
jgi:hypothetical protein